MDSIQAAKEIIHPILNQIMSARKALSVVEAIEKCADEINKQKGIACTFGFIQEMSLEYTIVAICKLFDQSSAGYEKHTIPKLLEKIEANFSEASFKKMAEKDFYGVVSPCKKSYLSNERIAFDKRKEKILKFLKGKIPTENNDKVLNKCLWFRNKKFAHAENLFCSLEKMPDYYPPLDEI